MTRKPGASMVRPMFASVCASACLCCQLFLLLFAGPAQAAGQIDAIPEQQLKAAYILNFARYAVWLAPVLADTRAPLVVCTFGQGVADIARQLQSRVAGSHPLELRNIARVEDAEGCHALYIGAVEHARQSAWLAKLRDLAILTIGDSSTFLADGGMINLLLVDGTIRFEVNLGAARHSGMSLHPRMLALAERVVGGASGSGAMSAWRNRWLAMPLQRKLLAVSLLTALAAMLVALMALASYDFLVVRPRLVQDLASRMDLVSLNLDVDLNFGDRPAAARTLSALRATKDIHSACLFDVARREFASYAPGGATARCGWPADISDVSGYVFRGDYLAMLAPVRFEREVVGYLQVEYALPPLAARLRQYALVLAVVMLTLFSAGLLQALSLRRMVTNPLLALSRVADQVTREQRYDLRVAAEAGDEVGRLGGAFNSMLAAIAARDAALRMSQSLLVNIFEKSSSVIYIKDLQGRYLMVNERFRKILRPIAPDPIGHVDEELFDAVSARNIRAGDHSVLENGATFSYEETVQDASGAPRTYISEKFCLRDERGQVWAVGGVSTDITERKRNEVELIQYRDRLEEQVQVRTAQMVEANRELAASLATLQRAQDELVRSEKLAALGSLVAGVAHELNTPIGNSLLAVSTLVDQTKAFTRNGIDGMKRSTLQNFLNDIAAGGEIVERNLHRAVDLVASFKQVAVDRTSSQCRHFMLAGLADEILLVLVPTFKKSGIVVRQQIPDDIEMTSYPGPFGQVLINLINNGLTHAFEGASEGEIVISARVLDQQWIELTVSDNGAGIAPENMGRIYDPFFTTKLGKGGSGLGLHIVYNIVYGLLGGRIEVDSTLGQGTRFIVTLPSGC